MSANLTIPAKADFASLLRGRSVALTGRLASMTRDDFVELIESHGARYTTHVGVGTGYLVVGQRDLPLQPVGTLPDTLRKALVLTRRGQAALRVMAEEQFLAELGLSEQSQSIHQFHSTASLTEALGVTRERIVAWVKAGLIAPAYTEHGVWHFEFRQVAAAKSLCDLARKGVTVGRLRKSLEQLRAWLPEAAGPLESLSLLHDDGRLLVRLADGDLAGFDGQLHFDFSGEPQPASSMRIAPGPRTAGEWYEAGLEQEEQGYHAEAESSYRHALMLAGPEAQVCFSLANVLAALDRKESAIERYRQSVEMDPRFGDAWNNLGALLAETSRVEEACDAFRKALAIDPEDIRAHYNLADALDDLGKPKEAEPHWKAYLRFDRTSQWAQYARSRLSAS
jgi:tetratricopeptide (TPR) repeat protein